MPEEGKRRRSRARGAKPSSLNSEPATPSPSYPTTIRASRVSRLFISLQVGPIVLSALVDTGSSLSYLGPKVADLPLRLQPIDPFPVRLANGYTEVVKSRTQVDVTIQGRKHGLEFFFLPQLSFECILGLDALQSLGLVLDLPNASWHYADMPELSAQFSFRDDPTPTITLMGIQRLTAPEKDRLKALLTMELAAMQKLPGLTTKIQHRIDVGDHRPIKQRQYPLSPKMLAVARQQVDTWLEEGVIEPSGSPWSSPSVIVRKEKGYRFCLDFRKINAISRKDAYPLPLMGQLLDSLRNARVFSKLDLQQAYLQVALEPSSREITAFSIPGKGHYHFRRMPYGLSGAPATFQRLVDSIIGPQLYPYCFAYLDDVIVATPSFEEHLQCLSRVFGLLKEAGLKLNEEKCEFACSELRYLGYLVNEFGLQVDPEKIAPIVDYPRPQNVKTLRRFLGMCSFYRRFIPSVSTLTAPLTKLLRKSQKWTWNPEQENAFDRLKKCLTSAPLLTRPDYGLPFVLQTDASNFGLGAVLTQQVGGIEHVIAYASKSLTKPEQKYSATEKECLAVVWAVRKFRPYLEGEHFTVVTDHNSLRWLHNLRNPSPRLARWALELQDVDLEIRYRRGAFNHVPDALSRIPEPLPNLGAISPVEEDPWYHQKFAAVERTPAKFPDWRVENDRLYVHRVDPLKSEFEEWGEPWKLVLPKGRRREALRECHDHPTSGHPGVDRTVWRARRWYYWPGMYVDTRRYVKQCQVCQKVKPEQRKPPGLMGFRTPEDPWAVVATDIMGPLPTSTQGFKYLLIFEDVFTKWVEIVPLRSATAASVTKALRDRVLCRWGTPRVLLSDNGTPFLNKMVAGLTKNVGIHHATTPVYHPQANPVERVNRVVKTIIASYVGRDHRKWDRFVPEIMLAINGTQHASTGYSPAFLNFGRELRSPEMVCDEQARDRVVEGTSPGAWAQHMRELREAQRIAEQRLASAARRQQTYYNLRRRDSQFKEGDLVLKRNYVLSSGPEKFAAKLAPKFEGPYRVDRVISSLVYELGDPTTRKNLGRWHISKLKPYTPPTPTP